MLPFGQDAFFALFEQYNRAIWPAQIVAYVLALAALGLTLLTEQLTGRSLGQWTTQIRDFVRTHPLQALAVTIGLGYVLGKLARRG